MKVIDYIHEELEKKKGLLFSVVDPIDYKSLEEAVLTAKHANEAGVDVILVGGSTLVQGEILDNVVKAIKQDVSVPVVLFPGNIGTVTKYADAIYFMSMLNSRNPYWISKAQMLAAPMIKMYGIEPIGTAYCVVEPGGTVGYVGDANLIPRNRPKIARFYGLAAEYLGFQLFITDAGSAAPEHVPLEMIREVAKEISIPYVVAGGIRTEEQARNVIKAGANIIQVGTAFEKEGRVKKIRKSVKAVRGD